MDIILDTHAFLWYANGNPKLSRKAKRLIDDASNDRSVSVASLWEMAIKYSMNKLELSPSYEELIPDVISANGFSILKIELSHAVQVARLGFPDRNHKDPFDRLMIAQSMVENIPVVSIDDKFDHYPITRLW